VSNAYIRNRGQTSFPTQDYDEGWSPELTNNTPPVLIYVRVAPSQRDPSKTVFWVNGWERPRIVLRRGHKYQVNVNTYGNPFYFTTNSEGGAGDEGNITQVTPSDYYVSTYTMNPGVPNKFYYQCSNVAGMGGEVVVE
jgi:hypothetical protein